MLPGLHYNINDLFQEAKKRWLKPTEVFYILQNHDTCQFTDMRLKQPRGGTVHLFNKKVVPLFPKDGHNWRKKPDGITAAETHKRLKVGNVEALNCYYADGEKKRSLHRRSYWMLNPEYEHVVLVHYRDTKISAADKTQSTPDTSTQPAGDVSKGPSKGEPSKAAVETDTTTEVLVEENPPKDNPNGETSKDDASSMEFVHTNSTSQANPDNSNEQMDFDDAFLPEAEEGGSEILPESLTSKLSASIGMSEGEFDNMRNSQPDLALQLLMDKKCELAQNSSSDIGGTSNRSDAGIRQRQDSLLHKFHSEYLNGDVLKSIEENANAAFAHKNFLNHLHNLRIDEATLSKVIQLESIMDKKC